MSPKPERDEERVSLQGLDPEEALRALMSVDPDERAAYNEKAARKAKLAQKQALYAADRQRKRQA